MKNVVQTSRVRILTVYCLPVLRKLKKSIDGVGIDVLWDEKRELNFGKQQWKLSEIDYQILALVHVLKMLYIRSLPTSSCVDLFVQSLAALVYVSTTRMCLFRLSLSVYFYN
jgi:hypothetical protein